MSSSFGRKKSAVRESGPAQAPAWLPRAKAADHAAAQEMQQAFYRITHTEPSRLERARAMRARYRTAA